MSSKDDDLSFGIKAAVVGIGIPVMIFGLLLIMIPVLLYVDFVTYKLYSWFALPLGAPHLNYWHIVGLSLLLSVIRRPKTNDDGLKKTLINLASYAFGATVMLLVGLFASGRI